jgi:acetate CoA/acetoacetate CoA-transferase alpha subunit
MKSKVVSKETIKKQFHDDQTIMMGGFACHGSPDRLIDLLVETGVQNLHMISNDAGDPDKCAGRVLYSGQAVSWICSHVGMNPDMGKACAEGKIKAEFNPQGTLVERIRCGGAGIGGILLRAGMGTVIEEGRRKVELDGVEYILWSPLTADIALVHAKKADEYGNLIFHGSSRNYNPIVAMAGKFVIVETEEIVPTGSLDIDAIHTPGIFVHMILAND